MLYDIKEQVSGGRDEVADAIGRLFRHAEGSYECEERQQHQEGEAQDQEHQQEEKSFVERQFVIQQHAVHSDLHNGCCCGTVRLTLERA